MKSATDTKDIHTGEHPQRPAGVLSIEVDVTASRLLTLCLAIGLPFLVYGHWLSLLQAPVTPAQDLAKHLAIAINFKDALDDGQWLPRLQLHHQHVADIPVFQYYGFMTGLSAYPFLKANFSALHAVTLSIIALRALGLLAIYRTVRLCGLDRSSGWLAMALYTFEPYFISSLYGRVAIPEFHAQSLLPLLLMSLVLFFLRRHREAFVASALTLVALAFTHNIFFLYGGALFLLAMAFPGISLAGRGIGIAAFVSAVCLSSVQWLPAFLSVGDFVMNFYSQNPIHSGWLTLKSGLVGYYHSLGSDPQGSRYFFTYSWWTLPGLLGLLLVPLRSIRLPLFVIALLFLMASSGLVDIWSFLPRFTYALQFPYRLISFVALLAGLGAVALAQKTGKKSWQILVFALAAAWALPVIYLPSFDQTLATTDAALARDYASTDYIAQNSEGQNLVVRIIGSDGWLRKDNVIYCDSSRQNELTLTTASVFRDKTIEVGIVDDAGAAHNFISAPEPLAPGELKTMRFQIPKSVASFRIWTSASVVPAQVERNPAGDQRELAINISSLILNGVPLVGSPEASLIEHHGLGRVFRIPARSAQVSSEVYVTLPIAYSRFWEVTQNEHTLDIKSSAAGTIVIRTASSQDIYAYYRMPSSAIILTLVGLMGFIAGCLFLRIPASKQATFPA